jgi:nicotinamide mononucleotide (NMN) deamidase PncC
LSSPIASPTAVNDFVAGIHASGMRLVLGVTGGGSQAISTLLSVPGGSRSVLAAVVPYSATALAEWLRGRPDHFCSEHTARLMAMAAYEQAQHLAAAEGGTVPVAGVACTASLTSDRPKHGAHRVHVAAQTAGFTAVASLELTKGARDRQGEEDLAARFLLNMVAQGCGLPGRLSLALQAPECVVENGTVAPAEWKALFAGEINHVLATRSAIEDDRSAPDAATTHVALPTIVFPGAFHPLHAAHRAMAEIAAARLAAPVHWEISIANVEKPPLDFHEMRLRSAQFTSADSAELALPLWFTRAPTFVEKAAIFPGATFIVGADTIERIAQPRYYGNDPQACQAAIESIAAAGCRFLVFGRRAEACFDTLADLRLPPALRAICDEVSEEEFRHDLSSTELRRGEVVDD